MFGVLIVQKKERADRLVDAMPGFEHEFPLIDLGLSKQNAHAISEDTGVKRPAMYDLGYSNNNCVGCVKGGWVIGTKSALTSRKCLKTGQNLKGL